jgi:hypothetical protein
MSKEPWDDVETFRKFGYLASMVPAQSRRWVIVRCPEPGCSFRAERRRDGIRPGWRCRSHARKIINAKRVEDISALPIDSAETLKQYGYPAENVGPKSQRWVVVRCVVCGELVKRKRCQVKPDSKCRIHSGQDPVLVAKKKRSIVRRFGMEGLKTPEIQRRRRNSLIEKYGTARLSSVPKSTSKREEQVRAFVESLLGEGTVEKKDLPDGKSIDIYIPSRNVGIEYHGLKWHHELNPYRHSHNYHLNKLVEARKLGMRLIQIYSDEWRDHQRAVKNFIGSALGCWTRKIGARKCELRKIEKTEAKTFMDWEHILGGSNRAVAAWGLFEEQELIGAITVAPHHRKTERNALVLDRLCFKTGVHVPGGASRLMKAVEDYGRKESFAEVISWSDERWSEGRVYLALGFVREKTYGPDYQYVDLPDGLHRYSKQSQKKSAVKCPSGMTEFAWAQERGLARIWGCGKVRWVKNLGGAS